MATQLITVQTISSYCVQIVIPLQTTLETSTKVTVGSGVLQNKP